MLYNNLIYFLVAIFTFSTNTPADSPFLPGWIIAAGYIFSLFFMLRLGRKMFASALAGRSDRYFSLERKLSIIAVLIFIVWVYVLDLKYYLQFFSVNGQLPVLENLAGLGTFFLLLSCIWIQSRPVYSRLFGKEYQPLGFILWNIKINLPIVLPWLLLSFIFDVLVLLPFDGLQQLLLSAWGDLLLFGIFVCFLVLFFPPLVRWLWDCKPLAEGKLLEQMQSFCAAQGFRSPILNWPLFEGQVLTAGIMGIVPGFRYLLVTPALLEAMNEKELESVLAHEIGHVKHKHLVLYVLLFLGFSMLAGALATPIPHYILSNDLFYYLLGSTGISPQALLGVLGAIPLLLLLVVYFRVIFGFFIRNFERQADGAVFTAQDTGRFLISSFEKIAYLTGTKLQKKNWHHFGLGERIAFLEQCEQDRGKIGRHNKKVYSALLFYFCCVIGLSFGVRQIDVQAMSDGYELRYAEAVLLQKSRQEPGNSLWPVMLGDLMQSKQMESKAIAAYEQALKLKPTNPEVNNNLAWLLLTAEDTELRDAARALTLARTAVLFVEKGFVLDTLATAFWANGLVEDAITTEVKAIQLDPANRRYYMEQIQRFKTSQWAPADEMGVE